MDDMNVNELYEAFGLEAPADTAETADSGTSPEDSNLEQSDPSDSPDTDNAEDTSEQSDSEDTHEDNTAPDTDGVNSSPVYESKPEMGEDAAYARAFVGKTNPYTGEPITSKADFERYNAMRREKDAQRRLSDAREKLSNAGINEDDLMTLLENTTLGKQLIQSATATRRIEDQMRQKAIGELIDKDLAFIHEYDESITDLKSLENSAVGKEVMRLARDKKLTYAEAWKLASFDKVQSARSEGAKKAAAQQAQSKSHLSSTAQRGSGEIEIPADVARFMSEMDIKDKDEQLKFYKSYINQTKGR